MLLVMAKQAPAAASSAPTLSRREVFMLFPENKYA
jgi:hypothetical protein